MDSSENPDQNSLSAENSQRSSMSSQTSSDATSEKSDWQMNMNNTVHNLSKKLEQMQNEVSAAQNQASLKSSSNDSTSKLGQASDPRIDKLIKEVGDLETAHANSVNRSKLNNYAKQALKKSNLSVSSNVFNNYIVGNSKDEINDNIAKWQPIQKQINSAKKQDLPKQSHRDKHHVSLGKRLAETDKNDGVRKW